MRPSIFLRASTVAGLCAACHPAPYARVMPPPGDASIEFPSETTAYPPRPNGEGEENRADACGRVLGTGDA
jgi:hypothetical protein